MSRPDLPTYLLAIAKTAAMRVTCPRRKVGCVLASERGHILATGYNGVPAGLPHCIDKPCPGSNETKGLTERCAAIHAEQNAISQCTRPDDVAWIVCTTEPCSNCLKLLLTLPQKAILVVGERYHGSRSIERWAEYGRDYRIIPND